MAKMQFYKKDFWFYTFSHLKTPIINKIENSLKLFSIGYYTKWKILC